MRTTIPGLNGEPIDIDTTCEHSYFENRCISNGCIYFNADFADGFDTGLNVRNLIDAEKHLEEVGHIKRREKFLCLFFFFVLAVVMGIHLL